MTRPRTSGRYGVPDYVIYVQKMFFDKFPDSTPDEFVVDHIIKYFWDFVKQQLQQETDVQIFSVGKFYVRKRTDYTNGKVQYYPKFKFSKHLVMNLRKAKGTNTDAEQRAIQTKREFIETVWNARNEYIAKRKERQKSSNTTVKVVKQVPVIESQPYEDIPSTNPYEVDISRYTDYLEPEN